MGGYTVSPLFYTNFWVWLCDEFLQSLSPCVSAPADRAPATAASVAAREADLRSAPPVAVADWALAETSSFSGCVAHDRRRFLSWRSVTAGLSAAGTSEFHSDISGLPGKPDRGNMMLKSATFWGMSDQLRHEDIFMSESALFIGDLGDRG
jgi:hypothetical protein